MQKPFSLEALKYQGRIIVPTITNLIGKKIVRIFTVKYLDCLCFTRHI
jgi:hypothetical protein